ncbi:MULTISPECIES: GIY-YIG nuclease family protein [unclassified Virgibacillus]|uniref:GIY-YIG nuclease family protein n=1 Tax=unclassified Virgibacillus TaxID=2620237 RepID=UPI0024DE8AA9|nr:GIY-YIG nuclease family protein [Virgibacillus sp. LDC-1]
MDSLVHTVYILKCKDDSLYTGYTNDLQHRLTMHEQGKGAKYTRGRGPFQVMHLEKYATKEEALRREYAIKQLKRNQKWQLITGGSDDEQSKKL